MFRICGQRSGGSSMMNSDRSPGSARAARNPTMNIWRSTTPNSVISAANEMPPRMPRMVASWAEHGTPSASRSTAISRSLGVPSTRVVIVAIVSQPEPEHHRQHGLAVQAHRAEDPVAEDGEARDVAGVLEEPEHEEERGDDGQHDGDGVVHPHRDEAVVADEEGADRLPGDEAVGHGHGCGVDEPDEQPLLDHADQRLRPEHAHARYIR